MKDKIHVLLLIVNLAFCFNNNAVAGNLQLSAPLNILPALLKGAYSPENHMLFAIKQLHHDDTYDDENKRRESTVFNKTFDFDEDLEEGFDNDPEEMTESLLPPVNQPEDTAGYHAVLEWDDTGQKYKCTLVCIQTVDLQEKQHLYDDSFTSELHEKPEAPNRNSICITLPRTTSSEPDYPVAQSEQGESGDSEDDDNSSSDSRESDKSGASEESQVDVAEQAGRCLSFIRWEDINNDQSYGTIDGLPFIESCDITERGASELQANNPELFATTKDAREAFEILRQDHAIKNVATREYQALTKLIMKYKENEEMNLLFSSNNPNNDYKEAIAYIFTKNVDNQFIMRLAILNQLTPLRIKDNDELLVICNNEPHTVGFLTESGAIKLHKQNPELFVSSESASRFFAALGISHSNTVRDNITTQQYQAIARFIQDCFETGCIDSVLSFGAEEESKITKVYIDKIPYGMLKKFGYGCFDGSYGYWTISQATREKYKEYCKQMACLLTIKEHLSGSQSDSEIIETLMALYPPDDNDLTLEIFMENTKCRIGSVYKQARESFEKCADLQNRKRPHE